MKHWPFSVKSKGGKPVIGVNRKGEDKEFTPEEVRFEQVFSLGYLLARLC